MEETPKNREENMDTGGAGMLSEMPSFEEHMSKAEQVPTDFVENIQEEYQDFMKEQAEQRAEYQKIDEEIFEGIRSIENKADRDLATAILPLYYTEKMGDEDGMRSEEDLVRMQAMQAIANYMNGDKTEPLEKTLYKVSGEARERNKNLGAMKAMNISKNALTILGFDLNGGPLNGLRIGQKIDTYEAPTKNGYTNFEVPGREYGANFYFDNHRVERTETAVTAVLAEDIAGRLKNSENAGEREIDVAELDMLSEAYDGALDDYTENSVEKKIDFFKRTADREMRRSVLFAMTKYESEQNGITLRVTGEGGAADFIAGSRLLSQFHNYQFWHKNYLAHLEVGKRILAGEDWREIERPNLRKLRDESKQA